MLGTVPVWVTVLQLLTAGLVGGFAVLQWVWWRDGVGRAEAAWSTVLSVDIGLMLLAGGLFSMTSPGAARTGLLFVHSLLLAGFLLLALPATRTLGRGPSVRWWLVGTGALLLVRAVLWWTPVGSPSHDGPVTPVILLVLAPTVVVLTYVVVAVGRARLTRLGALLVTAGAESVGLLLLGLLLPGHVVATRAGALWAVPLAVGLQALGLVRLRQGQRAAHQQQRMREAVASLANSAWFAKGADSLLVRARDEAREVLGDPTLEGSLRPISRGRYVAEFFSEAKVEHDARERAFLVDLAQLVATAAERYQLTERLNQTAFTDSLTRLPNRRSVQRHLVDVLDRANVERTRVSVVYCDLDGFKRVNDVLGHGAGDTLLIGVADYLRTFATSDDVFVGRLGGDEFVVVLSRAPQDVDLVVLARRLREGFVDRSVGSRPARLSVGVATWVPGDVVDADALVSHADTAMLEAKRNRSGYRVFDRTLRRRVEADRTRRVNLEAAVENGQFTAFYQPVVDAHTLEVVQVEALARWDHHGQLILPADWLELAEETGLIVPIGMSVLAHARRSLERFQIPVAVNIAARQLAEPDALDQIETAWGDAFWEHLTLEITESALVTTATAVPVLSELRARGVRIAVDDFGTGYSSMARLSRLPVDALKIDRSFVQDVGTERGRGVVRAIVALADTHGLDVVAEGVEHASDLTDLIELGVHRVQGNFLGRAAPNLPVRGPRPATGMVPVVREHYTGGVPQPSAAPDTGPVSVVA